MNNPISENELIALIKKYSFFYENELNKFNVIKNESHNTYKFNYNKDFQHECNIILNQYILNIKKYTPLLLVEQKLYQELVNTVNKYNKLNLSKYEFETLFSLIQIKSVLLSFGIDENAPLFSFLLSHIRKMEDWASQTYENHGISFCLGVDPNITEEGEINLTKALDHYLKQDYG